MTQQRDGKAGRPRRIGEKGARILRPRAPARGGGAGRPGFRFLLRANPQQENGDARGFRRARQTQGRGKVERARRPENLDQHRAEALAAHSFDSGAQNRLGVLAAHQRQGGGIGAEFGEPHAIEPSGFAFQKILPHPKQRAPRRGAQGQRKAEAGGCGPVGAQGRMNLMQAGAAQSPAETGVHIDRPQGETCGALRRRILAEQPSQDGHGFRARRQGATLSIDPMHGFSLKCSCYVLTEKT